MFVLLLSDKVNDNLLLLLPGNVPVECPTTPT
jgi:hypothetical protein